MGGWHYPLSNEEINECCCWLSRVLRYVGDRRIWGGYEWQGSHIFFPHTPTTFHDKVYTFTQKQHKNNKELKKGLAFHKFLTNFRSLEIKINNLNNNRYVSTCIKHQNRDLGFIK